MVNVAPMIAVVSQTEHTETTVAGEGTTETHETGTTGEAGAETHAETAEVANPILLVAEELIWGGACFLLLWALMKFVLLKPILKTMDERAERIQRDLDAAERARDEAAASLAEHEASLASARVEASQIIDAARAEAEARRREILAALLSCGGVRREGQEPDGERSARQHCLGAESHGEPPQPEMMNARTKPKSARASVKAMPRNMVVRTMPAASGWRAIASTDLPTR